MNIKIYSFEKRPKKDQKDPKRTKKGPKKGPKVFKVILYIYI